MSVTERLDKFMREHGCNKADVARLSGIPYTTIDGLYKKGDENTKLSTLRKLAVLIGCTIDELTDGNKDSAYYLDPETTRLAQEIYDNPEYRVLFDATKKLKPASIKEIMKFIDYQKAKESSADE